MSVKPSALGGYFSLPLIAHLVAFAGLALMYANGMNVLGGTNTLVMMAIVQVATLALLGFAWLRTAKLSFSARSALVLVALLGPLYTLLILALYVFAISSNALLQALSLGLVVLCLVTMGRALRQP